MSYCDGTCEHLNARKHKCELTGEKLTYMSIQCMNAEDSVRKIRRTRNEIIFLHFRQ